MQLSTKDAREIALQILAAAESAEQDGFLVDWGQEKVGLDGAGSAQLMSEFRKWREQNSLKERCLMRTFDDGSLPGTN